MWTSSNVRRHIFRLPKDTIFTTRDLLNYGNRSAIDQTIYRLIKSGDIIRLAWGVFVRFGSKTVSIDDVIKAKAKAFGKEIDKHSSEILKQLNIHTPTDSLAQKESATENAKTTPDKEMKLCDNILCKHSKTKQRTKSTVKVATNGRSSSFRIGTITIELIGVSARKMQLVKHKAGRSLLALWALGKDFCDNENISKATNDLRRTDREYMRQSKALIPAWLADIWSPTVKQFLYFTVIPEQLRYQATPSSPD